MNIYLKQMLSVVVQSVILSVIGARDVHIYIPYMRKIAREKNPKK